MRKIKVDFTNVESYSKCDEGIHTAKIASIEEATTQGGDDMLKITFEVVSGACKGAKVFDNCVLTEKALWKLQTLLKAIGMKCDGKLAIDLDKLVGKLVDIEVALEEYEGKSRPRVNDITKAGTKATAAMGDDIDDTDDEDEEEEEKPVKKSADKKPSKKKPEPEPEEDEDEDWDDEEEEEEEEEPAPKKKPAKKAAEAPKKSSKKPAKKAEPEEEEEWEDEDDDWDEE